MTPGNYKFVSITPPAANANNSTPATASIDTKGWDWAEIIVWVGAFDVAMTTLKLQESDTDSAYADITGGNFATATNVDGTASAVPGGSDDNKFFRIRVNLRSRKRYLDLVAVVANGTTNFFTAFAILSRGKEEPNALTEYGLVADIKV